MLPIAIAVANAPRCRVEEAQSMTSWINR